MSALETYHAGGMPWREAIDQKAPRMVIRSNMQPIDHSYGIVDICRISEDADRATRSRVVTGGKGIHRVVYRIGAGLGQPVLL